MPNKIKTYIVHRLVVADIDLPKLFNILILSNGNYTDARFLPIRKVYG